MKLNLEQLRGKVVLVRLDLNIPLHKNNSLHLHQRITKALPLVHNLLAHAAYPVLLTHLGDPEPPASLPVTDHPLSTNKLLPYLQNHGFQMLHAPTFADAQQLVHAKAPGQVILFENLRFFAGEKSNDTGFAQQLSMLGDCYINNAFGTIHRTHASIVALPQQFAIAQRGAGPLVKNECSHLAKLLTPPQPFMLVLGGAKLTDKIKLLAGLLAKPSAMRPHTILLGGAVALPFLIAHKKLPSSYASAEVVTTACNILEQAVAHNVDLVLPSDLLTYQALVNTTKTIELPYNGTDQIVDIGPHTTKNYALRCAQAAAIFSNGTMGMYEMDTASHGTKTILQAIAANKGLTVLGGGNCVDAATSYGLENQLTFCSTGGGASMAFLTTQDPWHTLPGLAVLDQKAPFCYTPRSCK